MVERRSSKARPGGSARPVGDATTPPSFTPASKASRPARDDAQPVGATPADPPTRIMPAAQTSRPAAPAGGQPPRRPASGTSPGPGRPPGRRGGRRRRIVLAVVAVVVVIAIAWPIGLLLWADGRLTRVEALSGAADSPGRTFLLAGSDERDGSVDDDGTLGGRTDSILLLHQPESGPAALISLPRDSYVEIPGRGFNKLNAAYAYGGAPLLVETVELLTGMTIDHYVQIGMDGIGEIVNAVDGVHLCYDHDVDDKKSKLKWKAGCHTVKGKKALAFARMRYADPEGDVGRAKRQQQLIGAVTRELASPANLWQPGQQVAIARAGTDVLTVSEGTGAVDIARLGLAFRAARGDGGVTGTPPIASLDYRPGGVGSAVLLDPDRTPDFFADLAAGDLEPGEYGALD